MRFTNDVYTKWLENGRDMELMEEVSFIDNLAHKHTAFKGDIINGASIPRFFWRVIGCPFVGKYRRASVIHDVLCQRKDIPHKEVHKLFHLMMLHDGVSKSKAWTMYQAVARFGPKWK